MKYQLPQFIETEINIVGPFTLKQFLWIAGGASILFLLFSLVKGVLFFILGIPIAAIFIAFAFLKIQDVPLIVYLSYGLSYVTNPKKYVFKKDDQSTDYIQKR